MNPNEAVLVELKNVTRHYRMGEQTVRALDGVDLTIRQGEFVMIVGSSGSGKSTLMQILGCLDVPTSGRHLIRGQDVSAFPDDRLSRIRNRHVGFVFQQYNLLANLNVLQNIAVPLVYRGLPRPERVMKARRYAELLGLRDRLDHLPSQLSGGQSQRTAIARALITEPEIILADEPTGNLDSATSREIIRILHDLHDRGYTIIMVTHDLKYAEEGTRKLTISDGRILGDTPGNKPGPSASSPPRAVPASIGAGIRLRDLIRAGIREGLLAHIMRTSLTMLGIIIAVTGVVAMSSFSLGSKKKQADQIRALGVNLICIRDTRLEGEKLVNVRMAGSGGLRLTDIPTLRDMIPGLRLTAASRELKVDVKTDQGVPLAPRVLGVAGDYRLVNNLSVVEGRFLDEVDQRQCARVAVIGHRIARQIGPDSPVGKTIHLGLNPFVVVGVLADKNIDIKDLEATGVADPNMDLLMPLQTLLTRSKHLDMRSELDEIQVQIEDEDTLAASSVAIRRLVTVLHNGVEDFRLFVPLDLLKQKQQAQRLLDILTIIIASISLVVGGIGIMNIMLASVTERIREIGIRRAVGATTRDILHQFLSEAVIISVTGGLAGVVLALAVVTGTCLAVAIPIVVSPLMIFIAVAAATLTGLAFGIYPAMEAANKNPVEALRHE